MPLALMVFPILGVPILFSFVLGAAATILVLILNTAVEGSLWMSHDGWDAVFSDPEAAKRLALLSGVLLLIIESAVIAYVLVSPGVDEALFSLVVQRQCQAPTTPFFVEFCR